MLPCYIYWDKGLDKMPCMIKYIYEHNIKMSIKYNFNIILLTDNNINDYIDFPTDRYNLRSNFKSDIIRFYILNKYGGIWLDTDILILKDLNEQYDTFLSEDKDMQLEVEFDNKIGCCSIFMKKNTICSLKCVEYIKLLLNTKKEFDCIKDWNLLGPDNVTNIYSLYLTRIKLITHNIVSNGSSFITWKDLPGINKDKWIFSNENLAYNKALDIFNNKHCYYVITWNIYNRNNINENIIKYVFKNEMSVFTHLINLINF